MQEGNHDISLVAVFSALQPSKASKIEIFQLNAKRLFPRFIHPFIIFSSDFHPFPSPFAQRTHPYRLIHSRRGTV